MEDLFPWLVVLALVMVPVIAFQLWRLASSQRWTSGREHFSLLRSDPWLRMAQQLVTRRRGPLAIPHELIATFGSTAWTFDQSELLDRHRPGEPPKQTTHAEALENEALERFFLWLDQTAFLLDKRAVSKDDVLALHGLLAVVVRPVSVEDPHDKPLVKYLRHTAHQGALRVLYTAGLLGYEESKVLPAGATSA